MDSIYSRKKIKLPIDKNFLNNKRKNKKIIKTLFIVLVMIATILNMNKAIAPMFNTMCLEKAKGIATEILNVESSKILKDVNYEDLVKIEKDQDGNIKMLKINTVELNMLASDFAYNTQIELNKLEDDNISIPIGAMFQNKYLAGFGPEVKIKIIPVGSIITDFKSEFKNQGINQTLHRIYLDAVCELNIVTPYETIEADIKNQILMTEAVIVGNIPESYYNLEGIGVDSAVDLIGE